MRELPVKSTDRNSNYIGPGVNSKKEDVDISRVNTKAKTILKVVLIVLSIVAGTAVCTSVLYFVFLKKEEENNSTSNSNTNNDVKSNSESSAKYIQSIKKNKLGYKCTDIIANCNECKEITIKRTLALKPVDTEDTENEANEASIICTSCDSGYYPIYNEEGNILFCNKICQTGDSEFCKTCDSKKQNQCGTCNYGYYSPLDDYIKTKCKKCSDLIDNCEECYGNTNSIICTSCNNNYFLSKEKNICEPLCETQKNNNHCETCDRERNICKKCNEYYYMPSDEEDKSKCSSCPNNVYECSGTKTKVKILKCGNYSISVRNESSQEEITRCCFPMSGPNEKCRTSDYLKGICENCNPGYYLPSDDPYKTTCKKCSDLVTNCNECHGTLNTITCDSFEKFECKQKICHTGINEKCLKCDYDKGQCKSCNKGYYLPSDDPEKLECKKCNSLINYCEECHGTLNNIVCTKCENYFTLTYDENSGNLICIADIPDIPVISDIPISDTPDIPDTPVIPYKPSPTCVIGPEEKCLTCHETKNLCASCNLGYILVQGKCLLNYSFRATYLNDSPYEKVFLITEFSNFIKKIMVDGEPIDELHNYYHFPEVKIHEVYVLIDIPTHFSGYNNLFSSCTKMLTIHFTPLFNTSHVEDMTSMFSRCTQLTSINLSVFDTRKVVRMDNMFTNCFKLTSLDITNFNTSKVVSMSNMFSNCYSLTSIDLSHLKSPRLSTVATMFTRCYSLTSIDFSHVQSLSLRLMSQLFEDCINLKYVNFENVYTDQVTKMDRMFKNCSSLISVDFSSFNTKYLNTMDYMFKDCKSLTSIDIGKFVTSGCTGISKLFENCESLKFINMASSTISQSNDIFTGVPNGGTIITNQKSISYFEKCLKKKEWNIIEASEYKQE